MIDYSKISDIPKVDGNRLILDFAGAKFLDTFEITELFAYLVKLPFTGKDYGIINETAATEYLYRINFFHQLEKAKKMEMHYSQNPYTGIQNRLLELQLYHFKNAFYGDYPKICEMLRDVGLKEEAVALTASSLGELIDNAFSHNLGKWDSVLGPMVILLAQNFPQKKELCFSVCDFGVGFLQTLHENYPKLSSEAEAISLAIQPNITGRIQKRGGNGLDYLRKNVFNGFQGSLQIRSGNTLLSITSKSVSKNRQIPPFLLGANIFFTINYSL